MAESGGEDGLPTPQSLQQNVETYRSFLLQSRAPIKAPVHSLKSSCISSVPRNKYSNLKNLIFLLKTPSNVRKEKSPSLKVKCQGHDFLSILDSGAELNVMDKALAVQLNLKVSPSEVSANAANDTALDIVGQTEKEVGMFGVMDQGEFQINLGHVIVVSNLGVALIIGEPGMKDNYLSTVPYTEMVFHRAQDKLYSATYATNKVNRKTFQVARAKVRAVLRPGETVEVATRAPLSSTTVSIHPHKNTAAWVEPRTVKNFSGLLKVKNTSEDTVIIKRKSPISLRPFGCLDQTARTRQPKYCLSLGENYLSK